MDDKRTGIEGRGLRVLQFHGLPAWSVIAPRVFVGCRGEQSSQQRKHQWQAKWHRPRIARGQSSGFFFNYKQTNTSTSSYFSTKSDTRWSGRYNSTKPLIVSFLKSQHAPEMHAQYRIVVQQVFFMTILDSKVLPSSPKNIGNFPRPRLPLFVSSEHVLETGSEFMLLAD